MAEHPGMQMIDKFIGIDYKRMFSDKQPCILNHSGSRLPPHPHALVVPAISRHQAEYLVLVNA
jgi:hypothetical protein